MKPQSLIRHTKTERGFALVIILSAIVLLLALVVGFFSRVQSEIQSSSSYQSAESARNLSDYAVNLVLTQIKAGTAGVDASGNPLAWASQPGAIRTFDTSGNLTSVYKLYSSPTMVASAINPGAEATVLNTWSASPALFSDLNEPLNGQYPILDPSAAGVVKGFSITGAPVAMGAGANTAPMPSHWLYVLKDGQIVAPTGSGNTANVTGATADNPIIGRVAFWTDDETSKININTAAGGLWDEPDIAFQWQYGGSLGSTSFDYSGPGFSSFWSTPVASSSQEAALAGNQPVQREYQRYPGHPATTYLSAVLPSTITMDGIYSLSPRLVNEGSKGGSLLTTTPITPDADRLYQSVDEMIFNLSRTNNTGITKNIVEYGKFFLTASSRAPDVNLFNEPRISMWPITEGKLTPFDRLISFCETINGKAYYFFRRNPDSDTVDFNIPRNEEIRNYLSKMTGEPVPGFGGSGILSKYGSDKAQIITEIFDYIRSTNTRDSSQGGTSYYYSTTGAVVPSSDTATRGFGRFPTITKAGILVYGVSINKSASATGRDKIGLPEDPAALPAEGKMRMRAIFLFEMFVPGQGYGMVFPRMSVEVMGLDTLRWLANGVEVPMFPAGGTLTYDEDVDWNRGSYTTAWGGRVGLQGVIGPAMEKTGSDKYLSPNYPFAGGTANTSPEVDMPGGSNPTFDTLGGNVSLRIRTPTAGVVQEVTIVFPSLTNCPVPNLAPLVVDTDGTGRDFRLFKNRLNFLGDKYANAWITEDDVVQAVAIEGDGRMIAGQKFPPASMFQPVPSFNVHKRAHNFFDSYPMPFYGAVLGSFAPTTEAQYAYAPIEAADGSYYRSITNSPSTVYSYTHRTYLTDTFSSSGVKVGGSGTVPGDWDNGVGRAGDGAYVNFPDEGRSRASLAKGNDIPYFGGVDDKTEAGQSFFSPNRMIPSSVMLGSLPTGVKANKPWQTLLFRPSPAGHPGLLSSPDHLLLDFFNMPVVEPYAISEPLSTAGRVNMNYQILPYTYIERSTGVQAVLRSEQMLAIPNNKATGYKEQGGARAITDPLRFKLNLSETLKGFETRFANNDIFRSPSEICSLWLVPATASATYAGMSTWWNDYLPTGDNSKESSYARIYPRLTTKSNTYTVHYRVQALKKPKNSTNHAVWEEGKDRVQSEFRGSTTIERYIDPNDPNIPDYITATNPEPLDSFYKFRVIGQKHFNP